MRNLNTSGKTGKNLLERESRKSAFADRLRFNKPLNKKQRKSLSANDTQDFHHNVIDKIDFNHLHEFSNVTRPVHNSMRNVNKDISFEEKLMEQNISKITIVHQNENLIDMAKLTPKKDLQQEIVLQQSNDYFQLHPTPPSVLSGQTDVAVANKFSTLSGQLHLIDAILVNKSCTEMPNCTLPKGVLSILSSNGSNELFPANITNAQSALLLPSGATTATTTQAQTSAPDSTSALDASAAFVTSYTSAVFHRYFQVNVSDAWRNNVSQERAITNSSSATRFYPNAINFQKKEISTHFEKVRFK